MDSELHIDRFREVDRRTVVLTEVPVQKKVYRDPTETATADAEGEFNYEGVEPNLKALLVDNTLHTGVFRATVSSGQGG